MEGGAGSALGVVGEAVGTLDEVGAVRGVRVQPVVPFLAERCQYVWRNGALIRLPGRGGSFYATPYLTPSLPLPVHFSG